MGINVDDQRRKEEVEEGRRLNCERRSSGQLNTRERDQ